MKGKRLKYFSFYSPRIERKSHLKEVYMKIFHKNEFYKYMRTLASQRIEEKLFFKQLSRNIGYEKYYKSKNFKETFEKIAKGI